MRKCILVLVVSGVLTACDNKTDNISINEASPASAQNLAVVELDGDTRYEWSVRTITSQSESEWSPGLEFQVEVPEEVARAEISADGIEQEYQPQFFNDGVDLIPSAEPFSPVGLLIDEEPVFRWTPVSVAVSYEVRIVDLDAGQPVFVETYEANELCAFSEYCELESTKDLNSVDSQSSSSAVPTIDVGNVSNANGAEVTTTDVASINTENSNVEAPNVGTPDIEAALAETVDTTVTEITSPDTSTVEASAPDTNTVEASTPDTNTVEASTPDTSTVEASTPDTSTVEASTPDTSTVETSTPDTSTVETSTPDTNTVEASTPDTSTADLSVTNTVNTDTTSAENQQPGQAVDGTSDGTDPEIEALQASEGVLAFPGAIGYAKNTVGGRGGKVIVVDTVANIINPNDGLTSLREALTLESGPRTIVFAVGGIFDMGTEDLYLTGNDDSFITVACQTAPSPGVIMKMYRMGTSQGAHDIVFRHCTLRGTDDQSPGKSQAARSMTVTGGSYNIVYDHMSISWFTDENFQAYIGATQTVGSDRLTVSNSIVVEGDADSKHPLSVQYPQWGYHSMGPSCINNNDNVRPERCSFVNNYIAHNSSRNGIVWGGSGEVSNNIVYNWNMFGVGAKTYYTDVDAHLNNNLMKAGPNTTTGSNSNPSCGPDQYKCALAVGPSDGHGTARYSTQNNYYIDNNNSLSQAVLIENPLAATGEAPTIAQATASPVDVRDMAQPGSRHMSCLGASKPVRDAIDTRVIQEFYDGTGQIGIGENVRTGGHDVNTQRTWGIYGVSTAHPASFDQDKDGMPDEWELKYGLDPANPNDHSGDKDGDGYTNIEEYLAIAAAC